MEKKLLDESKATLIEEDVYLEEPVEEVSEEQVQNAFTGLINDIIKEEFATIEKYTSAIATLEAEELANKEEILTLLKSISDEKNIQIGMLTKALELIDDKSSELMNAGVEKAEEIISEPASKDLEQ